MKEYEAEPGSNIHSATNKAKEIAYDSESGKVNLTFNGIKMTVDYKSQANDIAQIYFLKLNLKQLQNG